MFKFRIKAVAVLATALSLSACAAGGTATEPASKGALNPEFTAKVQASVDQHKSAKTALPPNDGPKAVTGKKIAIVTITMAETGAKTINNALSTAVEDIGWTATVYDGQGSPTQANEKMQQATTTKPDAIVLVALDTTTVGAGLAAAKSANIPVACNSCWDLSAEDTKGPYVDVQPALSLFADMGKASAEYAYLQSEGHPKFLTFNDPALSNLIARQNGFDSFMKDCAAAGGDCSVVAKKPFQVANVTTTLAADAATAARSNPSFNAVWASFDFAGLQVMNGLRQAGLVPGKGNQFLVSSNGDGETIKLIASGGYQKATVAVAFKWGAYANIDNLNRVFAGQQAVDQKVPIRLFDQSNADQAQEGNWNGDADFRATYLKAWRG